VVAGGNSDGFEGNAQSFRVVTKLVVRFPEVDGIDLTRATLAAVLKYPWFKGDEGKASKKWSAYKTEKDDFEFARTFHPHSHKTLEAELMDWADDVAYSVHDLEDFHRCNALPWQQVFGDRDRLVAHALGKTPDAEREQRLKDAYDRLYNFLEGTFGELLSTPYEGTREQREQLRRMTSKLIGKYIKSIRVNPDLDSPQAVLFEESDVDEVQILKQITRDYIIGSPTLAAQQHGQKRIVRELYKALADESKNSYPGFLPKRLRYLYPMAEISPARFVADYIASLSEGEAIGLHARLTGSGSGSVLDPIVR
jgi:dGTPase